MYPGDYPVNENDDWNHDTESDHGGGWRPVMSLAERAAGDVVGDHKGAAGHGEQGRQGEKQCDGLEGTKNSDLWHIDRP